MLLIFLPVAFESTAAVVVGVFTIAITLVLFEFTDVLGHLIRPLKSTLSMLHIVDPLAIINPSVQPLKLPSALNYVVNEVALI